VRIGIDGSCWHNQRGFGRFARELLRALLATPGGHDFTLFFDHDPPPDIAATGAAIVRVPTQTPVTESAVASGRRSVSDILAFTRATAAHPVDVFFFPAVYSWFPLLPGRRSVVTVHDAIAEAFPDLVFPNLRARRLWQLKVRLALWQSTRVLTVSASAKRAIMKYLRVSAARIDVTTEAPAAGFGPKREAPAIEQALHAAGLPPAARFLLYVGGIAPHKNVVGFLRGFRLALSRGGVSDLYFVVAGDPEGGGFHSCVDEVRRFVHGDAALRERVLFAGKVSDETLAALYPAALAVVTPAFDEGFGLPAIEALACGTPVLSSAGGAVPEIIGDAGLLFQADAPESIATAIASLATDSPLREALGQRALSRAAEFSWSRAARLTLQSIERAKAP
jgi:glycosyltransferase involved in cell wall biosynthesis